MAKSFDELVKQTTTKKTQARAARRVQNLLTITKKSSSTVERWLQKPGLKAAFKKEYKDLLFAEFVLALMAEDGKAVHALAGELGVSKTVIQNLRTSQQTDMKFSDFLKLTHAYGYGLVLEKGKQRITL